MDVRTGNKWSSVEELRSLHRVFTEQLLKGCLFGCDPELFRLMLEIQGINRDYAVVIKQLLLLPELVIRESEHQSWAARAESFLTTLPALSSENNHSMFETLRQRFDTGIREFSKLLQDNLSPLRLYPTFLEFLQVEEQVSSGGSGIVRQLPESPSIFAD